MKTHCLSYTCSSCNMTYAKKCSLKTHQKQCKASNNTSDGESSRNLICKHCKLPFMDYTTLFGHVVENHPIQSGGNIPKKPMHEETNTSVTEHSATNEETNTSTNQEYKDTKQNKTSSTTALNNNAEIISIYPNDQQKYDLLGFYADLKSDILFMLRQKRQKFGQIKWYLNTKIRMERDLEDGTQNHITTYFRSKVYISLEADDNEHNLNEAMQKMNASMEEFIHKDNEVFPLYLSKNGDGIHEIDLLYLSADSKSHYCYIKNLNRFLSVTKPNVNNQRYFCRRCLHGFTRQDLLKEHYSGLNAATHFIDQIMEEEIYIKEKLSNPEPLIMNNESEFQFQNTKNCHICGKVFTADDIKLVNNESALKKLVAKPSFERFQIFSEDMVGVENKMTTLLMNQPIYAGYKEMFLNN
ncbi:hypothetical protein KUTeg_011153 [Tegillarca granosa]|uniref:C2H2-type domain-containing protein n=1 Tax=Tegillarca granosa TaxID=220873 RepID=A0ABQ9F5X6_TEGGR|nr:hypothetical protein KUTeg_011153 [Tegillarca granosa]